MAPTPASNATAAPPPMRQSCDRCHQQKLRCTRAGNSNTGACDRCLRKRAQCVYSSSLPKGRPSMYCSPDDSGPLNPSPPVPITPVSPATPVTPKLRRRDSAGSRNEAVDPHNDINSGKKLDMSGEISKLPEDTSMDISTDIWPWVEPLNWDDIQMDWSDQDSGQSMFNWHAIMNPAQTDVATACIAAFPGLLDRTAARKDGNCNDQVPKQPDSTAHTQSLPHSGHGHRTTQFRGSSDIGLSGGTKQNDPEIVIAELAQLSVHLSPLRRSSYNLAEISESSYRQNQAGQKPLIDDATFESVAAWLAHGSANLNILSPLECHNRRPCPLPPPETKTTGAMLYHIFSASQHLLEILRYLEANVGTEISSFSTPTLNSTPPTSASSEISYFGQSTGSSPSSHARVPSHCSSNNCNNIIRHLVIACHTMLLNIYAAVLIILEHDADPRAQRNTAALGNIRLVSVVQLCSYLIERQHQSMDLYLTSQGPLHAAMLQGLDLINLPSALQPNPPASDAATREVMKDLKVEVQERLIRLQQTLCI